MLTKLFALVRAAERTSQRKHTWNIFPQGSLLQHISSSAVAFLSGGSLIPATCSAEDEAENETESQSTFPRSPVYCTKW